MAQKQGKSPMVVKLGETLSRDHSAAAARNKPKAKSVGAVVPTKPSMTMRKELQVLGAAKGAAFDKAFVAGAIKGHKKSIAAAKKEIAGGQSTVIVATAEQALKMYEMHLQMAEAAQQGL